MTHATLFSPAKTVPPVPPTAKAASQRDLRLDFLRGYAVFVMVVNHIGGQQSWLYPITGGNQFYISAAEAFVFISGLVMGIIYRRVAARQGLRAVLRKSLGRARTLYLQTVGLTLLFAAASVVFQAPWASGAPPQSLASWLWEVLTLHQAYYLTDVLLLYTFLVVAAGPLLVLMARGFTPLVLLLSWGLWAVWQRNPGGLELPWAVTNNSVFPATAWQVLFISGLVLGFHREALARVLGRIPRWLVLVGCGLALAWFINLYRTELAFFGGSPYRDLVIAHLYVKPNVGLGRLLVFGLVFSFAFALVSVGRQAVLRGLGWLLLPLGQHALLAYGLHLFVVLLAARLQPRLEQWAGDNGLYTAALQLGGSLTIWALVMARLHGPAYARRLAEQAATAGRRLAPALPRLAALSPAALPLVAGPFQWLAASPRRSRALAAPVAVLVVVLAVTVAAASGTRARPRLSPASPPSLTGYLEAGLDDAILDDFDAPSLSLAFQDLSGSDTAALDAPSADETAPGRVYKRRAGGPRSC